MCFLKYIWANYLKNKCHTYKKRTHFMDFDQRRNDLVDKKPLINAELQLVHELVYRIVV